MESLKVVESATHMLDHIVGRWLKVGDSVDAICMTITKFEQKEANGGFYPVARLFCPTEAN